MNRFFIYKEYGAKYDMMTADISAAPSSMPDWELYQKGLEALASTVRSAKGNADTLKKALTLSDLLMKVRPEPYSLSMAVVLTSQANSTYLQIPALIFGAAQVHHSGGFPERAYGGGDNTRKAP